MEDLSTACTFGHGSVIKLGDILFWPGKHLLLKNGTSLKLRHKESETLLLLCQRYPNAVSRQEFEQTVWPEGYVIAHTITQTIKGLRDALGDLSREIVVTLPKQGYALNHPPSECSDAIVLPDDEKVATPEWVDQNASYYTINLPGQSSCLMAGILLGIILIFYIFFQFGRYMTWAPLQPDASALHPIQIGFDDKLDAPFLKERRDSAYYLLKKVEGHYLGCYRYKKGVKCESEN